jgi:hypothetical protein
VVSFDNLLTLERVALDGDDRLITRLTGAVVTGIRAAILDAFGLSDEYLQRFQYSS